MKNILGILTIAALSATALAWQEQFQGGQGGGIGGGMDGGSFGGGGGGFQGGDYAGQSKYEAFPGSEKNGGLYGFTKKSLLLTSGDKVTVTYKGKKGRILLVKAESDLFDAALEIEDPTGKIVAKNDDQYEGEQSPYIAFPFPADGDYKVIINNYRSNAGGPFRLYTREAEVVDAPLGIVSFTNTNLGDQYPRDIFFSMDLKKGKYYCLRNVETANSISSVHGVLIGPSGVKVKDFQEYTLASPVRVFEAKESGVYYYRMERNYSGSKVNFRFQEMNVFDLDKSGKFERELQPYEATLVRNQVIDGALLKSQIDVSNESVISKILTPLTFQEGEDLDPKYQSLWLPTDLNRPYEGYRYYTAGGVENYFAISNSAEKQKYRLFHGSQIETFIMGDTKSGKLERGIAKCFAIRGQVGDIVSLSGSSDDFEMQLDCVRSSLAKQELLNRSTHEPKTVLFFDKAETCLVRVGSAGGGGKGNYRVKVEYQKPVQCSLAKTYSLKVNQFGVYRAYVELEAKAIYRLESTVKDRNVSLTSETGEIAYPQRLWFNGVATDYFQAPKGGKHLLTIWHKQAGSFSLSKAEL
jgi:hypothetical protein